MRKVARSDAVVALRVRQRLDDTDVDPWLVDGEKCKIYDYVKNVLLLLP